jgi:acyl-CoA synthetase (AMP-forming)/AMP-acid ligase II
MNKCVLKPKTLLHHLLEERARNSPEKIAVISGATRTSYYSLNNLANGFCDALRAHNIRKGDIVAILHENSLEFIAAYFGILKAGAVAAPLSTDMKLEGLQTILLDMLPHALVVSARQSEKVGLCTETAFLRTSVIICEQECVTPRSGIKHVTMNRISSDRAPVTDSELAMDGDELACIIYTSGSSGRPKGVMLTHENIVSNTRSICTCLNLTERDVQMVVLPFSYVFGLSLLHTHIAAGGALVLNNQFCFTGAVLEQMAAEKVTGFSGVPSTYAYLLHRSPLIAMRDKLPSLRYCSQAGGHMARQIKLDLFQALPTHTSIVVMYGATEASARLTWLDPRYYLRKIGSVGKEIPGVEIAILDEYGNELPSGEQGELVAEGPNIMAGYYKDPAATERVLDDHGYHTGDLGYRDAEGFLFITGRRDNQMKVGGHRLDPQEIEDVILESGLVIEAAVVGMPDEILGVVPAALIVPIAKEINQEELLVHCARSLPRYKTPHDLFAVSALPKNGNGKVDRLQCADLIGRFQAQSKAA